MSKKQVVMRKIAGLCGIIAPLIAIVFTALAISDSLSWFRWAENALSDLGAQGTATAVVLFNFGLIICGLLGIMFAMGLMQVLRKRISGLTGTSILILACISLVAVGVFPETAGRIHLYVSVAFFTLFPISLFFIGASMTKEPSERTLGFSTILVGIFAAASVAPLIVLRLKDVAVHEALAALSAAAWSIAFGIKLYDQSILK